MVYNPSLANNFRVVSIGELICLMIPSSTIFICNYRAGQNLLDLSTQNMFVVSRLSSGGQHLLESWAKSTSAMQAGRPSGSSARPRVLKKRQGTWAPKQGQGKRGRKCSKINDDAVEPKRHKSPKRANPLSCPSDNTNSPPTDHAYPPKSQRCQVPPEPV